MIHILNYIKKNKVLWPVLVIGFIANMAMIFPSGTYFCYQSHCGLYFFGIHGTDSVWHLALSNVSFNRWPFTLPVFSGATLGGYNYLMDLIVFAVSEIGIPSVFFYFKVLPIVWFVLYTISLIRFGRLLHDSKLFIVVLLILAYFCGSFAYLYSFWHHGTLWGSSGLVALQSLHALANMQYAFSLVIILEVLILIKRNKFEIKDTVILMMLLFIAMGLKFYGGVATLCLAGLFILTKFFPINKKIIQTIGFGSLVLLAAIISIFLFYNPFASSKTGAILSFDPLATVHPTLESPELFYIRKLVDARYALNGHLGPRLIFIEGLTLSVYLFMNYGIRLLGLIDFAVRGTIRKIQKWELLVVITIVFTTLLNILFVQKGEWWNTVQFLYYGIFLSTLLTAQFIYSLLQKKNTFFTVVGILIILVSLPIDIDLIMQFTAPKALSYTPKQELDALSFLKKQPYGIVFQPLFNQAITSKYNPPTPMFANYDNAYVAAFSEKQVYYSTETQIRLVGVDYKQRLERIKNLDCSVLRNISYAYVVKEYQDLFYAKCIRGDVNFRDIFSNEAVTIYGKSTR